MARQPVTRVLCIGFYMLMGCFEVLRFFYSFKFKVVGSGPTCQSLFFTCVKKSNQKKAHNLTKIDPDITYLAWDSLNQYTLAAPT